MKKISKRDSERDRQDSVTVRNSIARKIYTPPSLPIHWYRRQSAAASVVVSNPLYTSSILFRRLRCQYWIIRAHPPPPTPPLSLYIPRARRLSPTAYIVVSNPSDALSFPRPLPMPQLYLLGPWANLLLSTPPSLLSTPWDRKHISASAVRDIYSGVSSLLLPPPTPPLSSSSPRGHLPLTTSTLFSPIPQAHKRDAVASVVVSKSSPLLLLSPIPRTHCLFLVLRRRLCCRCWVLGPVNTPPPPLSKIFTRARCIFCFLHRRLCCCCWVLGIIFLFRHLHCCCQFLRPVISTP